MKKILCILLAIVLVVSLAACGESNNSGSGSGKKVGFVTFGLGGDFFQMLADEYKTVFTEAGWDADYADGNFDPNTQIQACENYIANGVDALIIWAVAPEAMNDVIDQAMAKGIKVMAFVAETEKYDLVLVNDDKKMATNLAKLSAKWIDETYADAPDHSVPVGVLTCRAAETGVLQGDELLTIENYSKKAKLFKEIECADETMTTGQTTAENLYTTNPEVKVFITAHSGLGNGINNYYTGISSPVSDYTGMGIFCINGDDSTKDAIADSIEGNSPMRGTVMTGSVHDTAMEILEYCKGMCDGTYESGYKHEGANLFVYADSASGQVVTVSEEDYK